jgi:predicted ferric reductase
MTRNRAVVIWVVLLLALAGPVLIALQSPLLAWRDPVYILAGFAGTVALALLLVQPLLVFGRLPGLPSPRGRRVHRVIGVFLVAAVTLHVAALWLTSPPDVVDALLFASPTPFSSWGVIAMWAVFAAGLLALLRRRLRLRARTWRMAHTALALVVVTGSVVHAMLIEGTMETVSKTLLCALVLCVTVKVVADLRAWGSPAHRR